MLAIKVCYAGHSIEEGAEIFKKLISGVDILIENFRPVTLEKWNLGYEELKKVNPKLVMVRVSGYGQTGPYREKAGFGTPGTAFSGHTYLQGYSDRPPVSPSYFFTRLCNGHIHRVRLCKRLSIIEMYTNSRKVK